MKKGISLLLLVLSQFAVQAQEKSWSLVRERIITPWAEQVDVNAPLPEYPRPQLVRNNNWKNLNGLWNYSIVPKNQKAATKYEGKILVPFAVESALSGVARRVGRTVCFGTSTTSLCRLICVAKRCYCTSVR